MDAKNTGRDKVDTSFLDLSIVLDTDLRLLAGLCQAAYDPEEPIVSEIGHRLGDYLNRRLLLENHFFGRSLKRLDASESFIAAERARLRIETK